MKGVQSTLVDTITYKDVQKIMRNGYISFFQSHNWPFRKLGKKIQVYDTVWYDITIDMIDELLKVMFKKIEQMFLRYVDMNNWLMYDPEYKYPKYSLIIYGKKPIMKIKSLLYKKNIV
jgi:hypothetical protein